MVEIETYKKRMVSAIASTCIGVVFLMDLIKSSEGDGYKVFFESFNVFEIVISIIITVVVSAYWIRFVFAYVDFIIKEVRHERKMTEIAIQERIKRLQKE